MRTINLLVTSLLVFTACKNTEKETPVSETTPMEETVGDTTNHPQVLAAVFEAHGGFDRWQQMNNLCFEMEGASGTETHTISLNNRYVKVETKAWTIGYDGNDVWLLENKDDAYKGNARFYHNLMFYFYAMPFVLGDEGIEYTQMEPTTLDGVSYGTLKIGYEAGVGDSPDDEYILYYHPETYKMTWLAYTVTYGEGEKSDDWHFIKYDDWQTVNGIVLPKKLTWYNVENGKPTDERSDITFDKVTLTETNLEASVFEKPDKAVIVAQ
ncbi:DUF6503 family protein [Altibacter lentus]|uniref:DUF6503 family protein n=1 Tax=Altibacter lentus TaxID=1223410 RepID=UPI0005592CE9|nr:DUF6503 family protein [Altibacter lentus]